MMYLNTCFLFVGKPVSSSCPVETSPQSEAVKIFAPFSANCTSLSEHVEGMGWESSNGATALTTGVSFTLLNIKSVTDWDLQPSCFINFLNGSQCFKKLDVTVYSKSLLKGYSGVVTPGTCLYTWMCKCLKQ